MDITLQNEPWLPETFFESEKILVSLSFAMCSEISCHPPCSSCHVWYISSDLESGLPSQLWRLFFITHGWWLSCHDSERKRAQVQGLVPGKGGSVGGGKEEVGEDVVVARDELGERVPGSENVIKVYFFKKKDVAKNNYHFFPSSSVAFTTTAILAEVRKLLSIGHLNPSKDPFAPNRITLPGSRRRDMVKDGNGSVPVSLDWYFSIWQKKLQTFYQTLVSIKITCTSLLRYFLRMV